MAGRADNKRLAPYFRHEGRPRGLARSWPAEAGKPATWWTATVVPCSHSSHRRLRSRSISSLRGVVDRDRGGVGDDRAPVLPEGYPAESCYQIRLALSPEPGLEAGPRAVLVTAFAL